MTSEKGNVVFILPEGRLYLSTLWRGYRLKEMVRRVLRGAKQSHLVPEGGAHLARAVFCRLCQGEENGLETFGIALARHVIPDYPEVHVDLVEAKIRQVEVVLIDAAGQPEQLEKVLAECSLGEFAAGIDHVDDKASDMDLGVPP